MTRDDYLRLYQDLCTKREALDAAIVALQKALHLGAITDPPSEPPDATRTDSDEKPQTPEGKS